MTLRSRRFWGRVRSKAPTCGACFAREEVEIRQFTRDFESDTRHFFRDAWAFASDAEQMLMMLIALSRLDGRLNREQKYKLKDLDLIFSQRQRELRELEERGLLTITDDGGRETYSFASSVMEWWVIREIENHQNETDLKQREAILLNLLSRQQAEQISGVVKQVWQHKDTVEEVIKWAGKLAGAFPTGIIKSLFDD